jgi:ADP-heptose:LPS heptosyltransferase
MEPFDAAPADTAAQHVQPRRLLLCQPRWLGDVLLCTPALHELRRTYPDARIDFVAEAPGAAALDGNTDVDDVLVPPRTAPHYVAFLRTLRRTDYDAVVDFRSTRSTAVLAAASGAPLRVGTRGRGVRNLAYNRLLPRERRPVYMARQKLALLAPLHVDLRNADVSLRIAMGEDEHDRARRIWHDARFASDDTVVAVSGASRVPQKRWGARHWARVADALADAGARILLTHGPGERSQAAAIAGLMRHAALLDYGSTTVRELAAVYARCRLWLGNDGGPKHIAAAAGTQTVAVVAAGTGEVWNDAADARQAFVEAAAGTCRVCADGTCIGDASENDVAAEALRFLNAR